MSEPPDRTAVRSALEDRRAGLHAELALGIEAPGQMTYGSQAAAASQVFAQQRDLALRDKALRDLAMVDGALARLDQGTYGRCIDCGGAVDPERLEALPWAERCIDCGGAVDPERLEALPWAERCIACQRLARL